MIAGLVCKRWGRTHGRGRDGVDETASEGLNGEWKCPTIAAKSCPRTALVRRPQFGVHPAAADRGRKVSSGTVRYSLSPPKLRPLGGRRKRAARRPQKQARGPPSGHCHGRRRLAWLGRGRGKHGAGGAAEGTSAGRGGKGRVTCEERVRVREV